MAEVLAGRSDEIRVTDQTIGVAELESLLDSNVQLRVLHVDRHDSSPEFYRGLARLQGLQQLRLGGPVNDSDLESIVLLDGLEVLNLPRGRFHDQGLEPLGQLESLELFRFGSPNVTDAAMRHLAQLPRLRFLHLLDPPITDAGLQHLAQLEQLESLYVDGTKCTEAGLQSLLEHLPRLHLHYNDRHVGESDHVH